MSEIAKMRLIEERRKWRKEHPAGFKAKPAMGPDDLPQLFKWQCTIPGLKGSDWEGGCFELIMLFPDDFPATPPKC